MKPCAKNKLTKKEAEEHLNHLKKQGNFKYGRIYPCVSCVGFWHITHTKFLEKEEREIKDCELVFEKKFEKLMTKAKYMIEIKTGIDPKTFFPDTKHIIIYAFTIGERHYFRFDDMLNVPYNRALQTLVYYKEVGMNCDRDFLSAHANAFDNAMSKTTFTVDTLVQLKILNDQLKQRLELPKEPELMYKLASVVFFDQYENPEIYEFKYGENKIKAWKKNTELTDFFLSKPLQELIPYLKYAGENLIQFSQMIQNVSKEHLANISAMLSDEQKILLKNRFSL